MLRAVSTSEPARVDAALPTSEARARVAAPPARLRTLVERAPWRASDVALAALSIYVAHRLSPSYLADPTATPATQVALVHVVATTLAGHAVGLYERPVVRSRSLSGQRAFAAGSIAMLLTLVFFYAVRYRPIGRWVAALGWIGTTGGILLTREGARRVAGGGERRVLFVESSPLVRATVAALETARPGAFHVMTLDAAAAASPALGGREADELVALCAARGIDDVVVPNADAALEPWVRPALGCLALGCRLVTEADFYEETLERVPVEHVPADWLLSRGWDTSDPWREAAKRCTDVIGVLIAVPVALPLVALAALAIVVDDGGAMLFPQTRVGRFGRPFTMWKLRTMKPSAESGSARFTLDRDPRLTRVGRWLRKLRVDELPQLWNVLRGEMSWVGPRPEQAAIVHELERSIPFYAWRHQVRPGITGWAQLKHPYTASLAEARHKLELDLYYIRHRSWALDLGILLRTLTAFAAGAR